MFVIKMVSVREQFKVRPRADWVSSKSYNEHSLSFHNRIHSAPPTPSCEVTKSLLVLLGLLEKVSFGFVKLPATRVVVSRKHS